MKTCSAVAALTLTLAAHAARAQAGGGSTTTASGASGGAKNGAVPAMSPVEVKLESASIVDPLPFDVPFRLVGEVPAGSTELEVAYARTTDILVRRSRCEKGARRDDDPARRAQKLSACAATFEQDTARIAWQPAASQPWVPLGGSATTQSAAFSVTMPVLDAEQYYRFRFTLSRAATAAQEAAFRQAVTPTLDVLFASLTPAPAATTLTPDEVADIWRAVRSDLLRAVGPGLAIKKTSIFSNEADWATVAREFTTRVWNLVLLPQQERVAALRNYETRRQRLAATLTAVATSDPLERVLDAALASKDAGLLKAFEGRDASVALVRLDAAAADRLAAGQEAERRVPEAPALEALRDSAAIVEFATRFTQLERRLRGLDSLLVALRAPGNAQAIRKLVTAGELSQSDLDAAWAFATPPAPGAPSPLRAAAADAVVASRSAQNAAGPTAQRLRGVDAIVLLAALIAREVRFVEATTTGDESTIYSRYVSADAGYLYAAGMRTAMPYVGTNIYFRPINKNAPLSQRGGFGRRFSLTAGMSMKSVADDAQTRRDLPQLGRALVLGGGFRVRQSVRLGVGTLLFEKKDEDHPLKTSYAPALDWFGTLSFDIDVQSLPGRLAELFK